MSEIKINPDESDWTRENHLKLFAALKENIPKPYSKSTYSRGLKHVDWNQVAFPPFSPEACQNKWKDILSKMRKSRTLTELVDEAEEIFSSPVPNNRLHPDFPKKPTPPSAMFYEENMAKFHKQHPKLSHRKLLQLVAKKYKALPDEEKAQYVKKHKLASKEYTRRMMELKPPKRKRKKASADTSDKGEEHSKDANGLPPKPPFNGYQLFCKEQLSSMAGESRSRYVSVWAQRWRDLTESQRDKYSTRCNKLKRKYAAELNEYLKTLDEEEQQRILTDNGIKKPKVYKRLREVKRVKTLPGEPKIPSRSSNVIFCKNQMELLKEEFPNSNERFIKVNQMWRDLSVKEKQSYKQQLAEKLKKYSLDLQKWFKTLTAAEQKIYRTQNPSKCQYLDTKKTNKEELSQEREELFPCRPSDSEDEVIEISSSEKEEDSSDSDEEEEEEEEDGDNVFEIY